MIFLHLKKIICPVAGGKTEGDDTLSNIYEMDVKHRFKFHSFMESYRYLFGLSVIKADKFCGENVQEE